jgi:hypothetical protein
MELETSQHDTQAIKYLSIVLVPLVLGGALYSLVYNTHKRFDHTHSATWLTCPCNVVTHPLPLPSFQLVLMDC